GSSPAGGASVWRAVRGRAQHLSTFDIGILSNRMRCADVRDRCAQYSGGRGSEGSGFERERIRPLSVAMSDASARVSDDAIRQLLGALVDAYNSRDAEAWGRVFHPDALLRPTNLGDPHSASYRGSGVVRFLEEISEGDRGQLIRAREIRR